MRLILEEVIMSDRHMSDGKLYLFLQLFCQHWKNCLNGRLDSTVTDYVLLSYSTLINHEPLKTYVHSTLNTKKNHAAWLSIVFPFDKKKNFFCLRILKTNTEWCIKMVRTSNKKVHLCLRISQKNPSDTICFEKSLGINSKYVLI